MDNLTTLLRHFQDNKQISELVNWTSAPGKGSTVLTGMTGGMNAFVVAGTYLREPRPMLYICNDKESAAYLYNTLQNLLGETELLFFPDSYKRPMQYDHFETHQVLERTDAVNKINIEGLKPKLMVSYPEALFEQVVNPAVINESRIVLKPGEALDVETTIEVLIEYGFERVDFVYEPGQFSIRGGIVDIFSYGNDWPYRIELFDDEIEAIRTFDPTTQLSRSTIGFLTILPNVQSRFSREEKTELPSAIPSNTLVWIDDRQLILDKLQTCFEKAGDFVKNLIGEEGDAVKKLMREQAFVYPHKLVEGIDRLRTLYTSTPEDLPIDKTIYFNSEPQTSFNRNFKLLIEEMQRHEAAGIKNYLFTENSRQIERFYHIFEDLEANVDFHPVPRALHQGFKVPDYGLAIYTDHEIFNRFHRYRIRQGFTKDQAINLRMLRELKPGDFVTHIDHGVGRYSGLEKIEINGHIQESVRLIYKNNDVLYVSINSLHKISKYVGQEGTEPALSKLGGDAWKNLKARTKKRVKDIAKELIKLYARRRASEGFAFPPDGYLQNELEASFIYEDTPDQYQATVDVKEDMQKSYPMDRLICGDVGFGKTEVAIRAAFKAIIGGKQVAVLVPTTILALQHYNTFKDRLSDFPVEVDYINRFRSTAERKQTIERLNEGKVDIIIGTHALLNKEVKFKDLGLLIIDEEQKFGVAAKEKLRALKVNVDTLTLTATPIPRTLQFSLMAARDLSIIRTAPPNRQPIHTERRLFADDLIRDAIYYEVNRGGQVFFVHNRVKTLGEIAALVERLCPDIEVSVAHGQLEAKQLETTLLDFIEKKSDVLVCTNIIETGLDIPNANTIIINNAHQFGLSDLHQLRGRVGRSNQRAFCYLLAPPVSVLTPEARKRIQTIEEFSDLGSGFNIAMRDMDIRGAGNLLGGEQSGFISDIGYETYQKILEEAIQELKEQDFKDLFREELEKEQKFVREVTIESDVEMHIPDEYVSVIQERLNLYQELDTLESEEELQAFRTKLEDRFGKIPEPVEELFDGLRLRWLSRQLGFERISLKNNKLRCFFIQNAKSAFFESAIFNHFMQYMAGEGAAIGFRLKQTSKFLILTKEQVKSLSQALGLLTGITERLSESSSA